MKCIAHSWVSSLAVVFLVGCGSSEPDSPKPQWRSVTQEERLSKFHSRSPFTFKVYSKVGVSGPRNPIHEVSESIIEEEVRKLDWTNTEQEVVLDSRRNKLTVRGYTNATEKWFQLHVVWLRYGKDGNTVKYSQNLTGVDNVVEVLTSFYRKDDKWKTMLTWSDQLRPIPKRLLPKKMRDNPERVPSGVRVQADGS